MRKQGQIFVKALNFQGLIGKSCKRSQNLLFVIIETCSKPTSFKVEWKRISFLWSRKAASDFDYNKNYELFVE